MVQQLQLSGHKGPVTCLAHSSSSITKGRVRGYKKSSSASSTTSHQKHANPYCLLSGSEDGTARLWDLRYGTRASLCILSPGREEITSVAFHPSFDNEGNGNGADMLLTSGQYPYTVFVSVGSSVYGYDLRNIKSPIIKECDHDLTSQLNGGEEINQISLFQSSSSKDVYFAAADDDGYARVMDKIPNRKQQRGPSSSQKENSIRCKTLHHDMDESTALVTSIAFRPRGKTIDLATGGTDCTICLWDVNRPWRPSSSLHINQDDAGAGQICNPPMIHSLSWSPSGRLLAAGLGDGSTAILTVEGRRLVLGTCGRLTGGHDAAVAAVIFPHFGAFGVTVSSHITADDRLVVSGGNDGNVVFWDLGPNLTGKYAVDPSSVLQDCENGDPVDYMNVDMNKNENENGNGNGKNSTEDLEQKMKGLSTTANSSDIVGEDPKILFGIQHGKKPNWMESSKASESNLLMSLFVADTSNDITAYMLPTI